MFDKLFKKSSPPANVSNNDSSDNLTSSTPSSDMPDSNKKSLSLFSKKSRTSPPAQQEPALRGEKKTAPTPSRKEAQSKTFRPLVPDKAHRRARIRSERMEERRKDFREYAAMKKGDLANMPKIEQLPIRVYTRDYVDARWTLSEYFMPAAIGCCLTAFVVLIYWNHTIAWYIIIGLYVYIVCAVIDLVIMWQLLKRDLIKRGFAADGKGLAKYKIRQYAVNRCLKLRFLRVPKPRYKRRSEYREHQISDQ